MKVTEKGTDRRAEAHIYVEGQVPELEEYGEYIDPIDKAICCYVPVDEGHTVKIGGRFSGTTLIVAYDAVVDGVYRKSSSYIAKTVSNQKHKKLDTENFLYRTDQGIIDTEMYVAPLLGATISQGEGPETIGTMELRLYITRQIGINYSLGNIETYSNHRKDNVEDEVKEDATYKQIAPTLRMDFEKNSMPLDKRAATREQRRMETRRPGTEPWAIFRFHYRSKDAITERGLKLCHDPTSKAKTDPHTLDLEPVPPLPLGSKPQKDDGDSSTRASSPAPPATPAKSMSPTLSKKQPPEPTTTPTPKPNMTSTAEKQPTPPPEVPATAADEAATDDDSAAKPSSLPPTDLYTTNGITPEISTPAKTGPQVVIPAPKKPTVKPAPIATATTTAQKKPAAATPPVTPTKRTAEPTTIATPEIKRAKIVPAPIAPTTPTIVSRIPSGSASPRPMSIERKVAEQRRKLEAVRQKRLETAKKQEELDKQMEPFKNRMAEELERLNREMMEEEAAAAEDEEHLNASVAMLEEFQKAGGED